MSKILISDIGEHKELRELFCNKLIMGVFQEEIDELEIEKDGNGETQRKR